MRIEGKQLACGAGSCRGAPTPQLVQGGRALAEVEMETQRSGPCVGRDLLQPRSSRLAPSSLGARAAASSPRAEPPALLLPQQAPALPPGAALMLPRILPAAAEAPRPQHHLHLPIPHTISPQTPFSLLPITSPPVSPFPARSTRSPGGPGRAPTTLLHRGGVRHQPSYPSRALGCPQFPPHSTSQQLRVGPAASPEQEAGTGKAHAECQPAAAIGRS